MYILGKLVLIGNPSMSIVLTDQFVSYYPSAPQQVQVGVLLQTALS